MEERKLTKADIDKVRHIEGFPIGKDEDIIALSRPPYYTACPNPFIEEFIQEKGTPYDEASDDYHREPYSGDVSEGKSDPIYMAHSYHTKVPYRAIMRYILHYTKPDDVVLDGFCGTGMTGVAAYMCGSKDSDLHTQMEVEFGKDKVQWGTRNAILNDLSPAASFIAYNYNTPVDTIAFKEAAERILRQCEDEFSWMYETYHVDDKGRTITGIDEKPILGRINFTVWSDVLTCPACAAELPLWDICLDVATGTVRDPFKCPHCGAEVKKNDCQRVMQSYQDKGVGKIAQRTKQYPVMISYSVGKKRFTKRPDSHDLEIVEKIESMDNPYWYPTDPMMGKGEAWGETWRAGYHQGISHVHHFFTSRNLYALSSYWDKAGKESDERVVLYLKYLMTSVFSRSHRLNRYMPNHFRHVGPLSGTLYIPSFQAEICILDLLEDKLKSICNVPSPLTTQLVQCASADAIMSGCCNCIDYIFTDPPFGDNLIYSELNFLMESWLRVKTNTQPEAIIAPTYKKGLVQYQDMMTECFRTYYRLLKPNHWITVEFHNSRNAVWNAIQNALGQVGFIVADVQTIDKQKGTTKQLTYSSAVKQDLVISAYKPSEAFIHSFQEKAGEPEMVWEFVRQHLRNVPIAPDANHDGKIDVVAERQDYLLFDRMVAWHIMNGIPVPMDAHTFYEGLRQRFLERDGMFFLPDQVNEYDDKRAHMELDTAQLSFIVTDEKNAIQWLNYILAQGPMTYQEIQPLYMQELHQSRQEKMPELMDMLKENFVQDDKGGWYVPDLTNAADLAKVRRKALLKEFWDSCATGKGKLKVFRMEAIRAGFDECWKTRDFKTIVAVGERLPEAVLQEDPALLMYYDNACSRV